MQNKKTVSSHPTRYEGASSKQYSEPAHLISSPNNSFNSMAKVMLSSQSFKKVEKPYVRELNKTIDQDVDKMRSTHVSASMRSTLLPFAFNIRPDLEYDKEDYDEMSKQLIATKFGARNPYKLAGAGVR